MASAAAVDDNEDLFTCSVCFNTFNEDAHKPKFLSCFHTLCISCVKSIVRGSKLSCPICRKDTHTGSDVNLLTNNHYIIRMMTSQNNNQPASLHPKLNVDNHQWCLKCCKEASPSCISSSDHSTFSMGSLSAKVCQDLQQSKDSNKVQLAALIQKRNEAKQCITQLFDALKIAEEKIKKMDEENDFANMISLLGAVEAQQQVSAAPTTVPVNKSPPQPAPKLSARAFNGIHFDSYLFVMNFTQGSQQIGTVVVKPSPRFYRPLMKSLARFCQPKMAFEGQITKAHPSSFVTVELSHSLFKKEIPVHIDTLNDVCITDGQEVGLYGFSVDENSSIVDFQLAFMIKTPNPVQIRSCSHFGDICSGRDVLEELSKKRLNDRNGFNVWIEFNY